MLNAIFLGPTVSEKGRYIFVCNDNNLYSASVYVGQGLSLHIKVVCMGIMHQDFSNIIVSK